MMSPTAGGAALSPPPRERLHERLRRQWRSLKRHPGLRWWLRVQGTPIVAAFVALYVANGFVIGWQLTYEVMLAIESPATAHRCPALAWALSIAGWLLGPAIAGAVAGVVITGAISSRRTRRFMDLFDGVDDE